MRFLAIPTEEVHRYRAGAPDANGQPAERRLSGANRYPCRHCLKRTPEGQGVKVLVLAHRPFASLQPYAEVGPIFLCDEECVCGDGTALPEFLTAAQYIVRGYSADERIIYGTGSVVATEGIEARAAVLFQDPAVAFVHVRSASNNCYLCRIERG